MVVVTCRIPVKIYIDKWHSNPVSMEFYNPDHKCNLKSCEINVSQ